MNRREMKYALATVRNVSQRYEAPHGYDREDLRMAALESIIKTLNEKPELGVGGWMGQRAHYAMRDEIKRLVGRKNRPNGRWAWKSQSLEARESYRDVTGAEDEVDPGLHWEWMLGLLTPTQQHTASLLSQGYSNAEIGRITGVHESAIRHQLNSMKKTFTRCGVVRS